MFYFQIMWNVNKGKCGVCGDRYDDKHHDNEAGGKYAQGVIAKTYRAGQVATIKIQVGVS